MPQQRSILYFNSCRVPSAIRQTHSHVSEMKWILLLMLSLLIRVSTQQCQTTYSILERYLKGHVVSTHNVKDHGHCLILCSEDQRCQSVNFQARYLVCELNDADRHSHPWDYELKDGYAYSDYPAKVSVRLEILLILSL